MSIGSGAASASVRTRLATATTRGVIRDVAIPIVAARVVMLLFGWLALAVFFPGGLGHGLLGIWNQWDGPHFLEVAATGYGPPTDPARIVLFPLYPALIAVGSLAVPPLIAAMAISLAATVAAGVGLYRLVRLDGPDRLARMTVAAMIAFPTAYALVAPYSESLFLALSVWAFLAMRDDDPRMAGILGALAALTRIQGAFLLPALAVEYLIVRRRLDRDFLWVLFVAAGIAVYLGINVVYFGDPLHFIVAQETWFHVHNTLPWVAVQGLVNGTLTGQPSEGWVTTQVAPLVSLVLVGAVMVWTIRSRHSRPGYAVYTAISLLAFASLSFPISVPRYLLGVFPIFIALGSGFRSTLGQVALFASILLLGLLTTLFVMGHWAF